MKYLILVIMLVAAGGLIGYFQSSGFRERHDTDTKFNPQAPAFVYTTTNERNQASGLRLFEITSGANHRIYDFQLPTPGTFPSASFAFDDTVLFNLGLPEQLRIAISTQTAETVSESKIELPTLRSPSGTYIAFNRSKSGTKEGFLGATELVIQSRDGVERRTDSGSAGDIGRGMLAPLYWAPDEQTVYAHRVHATEGDIVGLTAIDVQTMEQRRIQKIEELGLSRYVFDGQGNVYGFVPIYRFQPEDKAQHVLYRVSLATEEATSFTLKHSSVSDIFTVDPTGRYLAYANGDDFTAQNLWIYDFTTGEEKAVTENAVVSQVLPWSANMMLIYREESISPTVQGDLVLYNGVSSARTVLVRGNGAYLSLIGWYLFSH